MAYALELVHARRAAAQLVVLRHGEVVLDHATGCGTDSLFWTFSAGKPLTAMLVHLCAQQGRLVLDEPVAEYWPDFAQHGKQAITVRHVLQHRAGVPVARSVLRDALAMGDWQRSVRAIERARPRFPAGQVPAYHIISYGFILGELVRRVCGAPVRDVLADQVLAPYGLRDTHLGLPDTAYARAVPLRVPGASGRLAQAYLNRRAIRQAVVPAAGVSTTARDLALFYEALRCGGELDGVRVFAPETITQARQPSGNGELDRFLRLPIRWSHGFQLGGEDPAPAPTTGVRARTVPARPMGRLADPQTFGHNGSYCCIAWADPTRELVFAYLTDLLPPVPAGAAHLCAVADAVLAACH